MGNEKQIQDAKHTAFQLYYYAMNSGQRTVFDGIKDLVLAAENNDTLIYDAVNLDPTQYNPITELLKMEGFGVHVEGTDFKISI